MKRLLYPIFLCFFLLFSCDKDAIPTDDPIVGETPIDGDSNDEDVDEDQDDETGIEVESLIFLIENGGKAAYVIDKDLEKRFEWSFEKSLGNDAEILDDGNLIAVFKPEEEPPFSFGGYGGILEKIDKDSNVLWSYKLADENELIHHDVTALPNGNYIFLVWTRLSNEEAMNLGIEAEGDVFYEVVKEINPNSNEIVWQWSSLDHMIQDLDQEAPNFGVIQENKRRIDFSFNPREDGDIMHANSIEYDADRDLIYISVNFYNETWVIDHSTSKEEAKGKSGGNYGVGGDLVYRFGNPLAYGDQTGTKILNRNHYVNIIKSSFPGADNALVFVNNIDGADSEVKEIKLPYDAFGNSMTEPEVVWQWTKTDFSARIVSSAARLMNGNTLIMEGDSYVYEVNESGEVLWQYDPPAGIYWRAIPIYDTDPFYDILELGKILED